MHVFFDEQIFLIQRVGGISRYICTLAEQLSRAPGLSITLFGGISRNLHLQQTAPGPALRRLCLGRRDRLRINSQVERASRLWRRWAFLSVKRRHGAVVYHPSYYELDPFIARRAEAAVVTFHDMIPEWLHAQSPAGKPDPFLRQRAEAVRGADGLLTVSRSSLNDLERCHPGARQKTSITPLASCLGEVAAAELPGGLPARFFLFVGNREGYKNGQSVLSALARLAARFPEVGAVFFGGRSFSSEESQWLQTHGLAGRVTHLAGDDALAAACYRQAVALVFPSLYEGFGLPVLEAMQLGCPVITSPCSSLPEVGGEAAVYVEPQNVEALADAMARMLLEPAWRAALSEQGRARSNEFSWTRTAAQTLEAYREALSRKQKDSRSSSR